MQQAYLQLHHLGFAHSIEVWQHNKLVGGLYGVMIGQLFCGESMFSRGTNGSKIAMVYLCQHMIKKGFELLDCQLVNQHLLTMGAESWLHATCEFDRCVVRTRTRGLQQWPIRFA